MSKPHPLSSIIPLAELDIFNVPPTQASVVETLMSEVRPLQPLEDNFSMIEFEFSSGLDEYVMLSEMKFNFQIQIDIKKNAGDIVAADWEKCSITNNLLHSIFKTAQMSINNKIITQSPQHYAYKAYFENLLGYTHDAKIALTTSWGFFLDQDSKESFDNDDNVSTILKPSTIDKTGKGKIIDLCGKLHLDMCMQPKALLGGTKVNIKLIPNVKEFYLTFKPDVQIRNVRFIKATLSVPKLKLNPLIVEAQNLALAKGNAKYPITRGEIKQINIPAGQTDIIIPNHFSGQFPRRIFVTFVENSAFNGDLNKNPFNFKTYKLNYLTTYKDGVQYPSIPYTPDFDLNKYTREYLSVFDTLNVFNADCYLTMERSFYTRGNTIYGINYASDLCDDYLKSGYIDPKKEGALGFHIKFKEAPTDTVVMIVYFELDSFIEIDINRQVFTDFN